MVVSMSKEFGVPFTTDDFEELHLKDEKSYVAEAMTSTQDNSSIQETSKHLQSIDNMNLSYMEKLLDRAKQLQKKDFIQEHINKLKVTSDINKKEEMRKPMTAKMEVTHNYSTQSLNSTELAKEKLRQILTKNPKIRYSYNQDYHHSMTFVPVNVEAVKKEEKLDSEARWQSTAGWMYPGTRSVQEDNKHPYQLHVARSEDLKERWNENSLHVGILQAPLDRDRYPWDMRYKDLDLYKRPLANFGLPEPQTIHLAGKKLLQEKLVVELQEKEQWKSKVVIKDPRQYFHSAYYKERSKMWRKTILPLTDDERDNHLFRFPNDPKRSHVLPELSLGERSMTQPQMSTINVMSSRTDAWPLQLMVSKSLNDPLVKVTTDTTGMLSKQQTFVTQPIS